MLAIGGCRYKRASIPTAAPHPCPLLVGTENGGEDLCLAVVLKRHLAAGSPLHRQRRCLRELVALASWCITPQVVGCALGSGNCVWFGRPGGYNVDVGSGTTIRSRRSRVSEGGSDPCDCHARCTRLAAHAAKRKGGYRSVTSTKAYPITRLYQRITPSTKWNTHLGYRPVSRMASQAMITPTIAAMWRRSSTM
jgi:hypothetical protein